MGSGPAEGQTSLLLLDSMDPFTINVTATTQKEEVTSSDDVRPALWLLGLLFPITLLAVGGNLLVLVSYVRDARLRSVHNVYIANLATADFLIGCFSMPLYVMYTIQHQTWSLGRTFCKVFITVDYTLCLETVLLVILISWDRLLLVRCGLDYKVKATVFGAHLRVAVSWLVAFSLYGPVNLAWTSVTGYSAVPEEDCDTEFFNNFAFTLATSLIEFCLSFLLLAAINASLYRQIRSRGLRSWSTSHQRENSSQCKLHPPKSPKNRAVLLNKLIKSRTNVKRTPASEKLEPNVSREAPGPREFHTQSASSVIHTENDFVGEDDSVVYNSYRSEDGYSSGANPLVSGPSVDEGFTLKSQTAPRDNDTEDVFEEQGRKSPRLNTSPSPDQYDNGPLKQSIQFSGDENTDYCPSNHQRLTHVNGDNACAPKHFWDSSPTNAKRKATDLAANDAAVETADNGGPLAIDSTVSAPVKGFKACERAPANGQSADVTGNDMSPPGGAEGAIACTCRKSAGSTRRRDLKAAKALLALVLTFLVTWGPYTVVTIVNSACANCVRAEVVDVFTWLLWSKSALNPLLYAFHSPRFRENFRLLLFCHVCRRARGR